MAEANWVREYQDGEVVPGTAYRVVRLMGVGGMGSVYEVEQVEIGRRYVFKQLLQTLASREDLVLRMEKEWKALGALRHPNVVDVVYAGRTADGTPYYVMSCWWARRFASDSSARASFRPASPHASPNKRCSDSPQRMRSGWCIATSSQRTSS